MFLKYNIQIEKDIVSKRIKNLINQIYKLLPSREQGINWEKPLETIFEELSGMQRILKLDSSETFFILLNKLEGLYLLKHEKDFSCYRRTIFECLSLMNELQIECLL